MQVNTTVPALLPWNTNFTDMAVLTVPPYKGNWVQCPACKGHGGCVLQVDAYGKGKHFKGHCMQCEGYGLVLATSKSATCVHEWKEQTIGRCLHLWTCKKCGENKQVDSGD